MQRLTLTAETLIPAPLDRTERIERVRGILHDHGIFPRRMSHAATTGLTITYAHVQIADGPHAAHVVAEALDWEDTDVTDVTGMVAVSTRRG